MKQKIIFLITLVISILTSCVKEVNFDDIELKQYVCINSFFCPENYFSVNVCLTGKNANINEVFPINNAKVVLWSGAEVIEELKLDSAGYYSTKINKPVANKEYTIKVDVEGFEQVSASDVVPEKVPVINHNVEFENYFVEKNVFSTLKFTFIDPPDTKNYYLINITRKGINPSDNKTFKTSGLLRSDDEIFTRDENDNETFDWLGNCYIYLLFHDKNIFELTNNNFIINYFENDGMVIHNDYNETKTLVLHNTSKHFYEYFKSLNILNVVVNEPIINQSNYYYNLYSNVENGLGIFAGYNNYLDTFLLDGQKYNCTEF